MLEQSVDLEGRLGGPDFVSRFAALMHDVGKPRTRRFVADGTVTFHHHDVVGAKLTRKRMQALKFSGDDTDAVARLVELHLRFHGYGEGQWTDSAVRRYVRDAGDQLERLHVLTRADCTTRNQRKAERLRRTYDELEERIARLSEEEELASLRPDLDGTQIMEILGIPPGPAGGRGVPLPARAAPRRRPRVVRRGEGGPPRLVGRPAVRREPSCARWLGSRSRDLAAPSRLTTPGGTGRSSLLDSGGDHDRDRRPRRRRALPAGPGRQRRRRAARRPVVGDRGAGGAAASLAGGAAHRLGEVRGLLRGHAAAARRRRRADGDRLARCWP